jgi:hypothetical protein
MTAYNLRLLALVAVAALFMGCKSKPSGPPRPSGFLSDYSKLTPHPDTVNRPNTWRYLSTDVDLRDYDRLIIDPVKVRFDPASAAGMPSKDELVEGANLFQKILVDTITPYYDRTYEAGPTALRLRVAVTDIEPGEVLVEGEPALDLVGVTVEAELIDSTTGRVIAAAVDRSDLAQSGRTVEGTFRLWAQRILDYLEGKL